jgi:hypothetical protein
MKASDFKQTVQALAETVGAESTRRATTDTPALVREHTRISEVLECSCQWEITTNLIPAVRYQGEMLYAVRRLAVLTAKGADCANESH